MKKYRFKKPLWLRILLSLVLLGIVACLWEFVSSQNPYLLPVKRAFKYDVMRVSPVDVRTETAGLVSGSGTFYVDGTEVDTGYAHGKDNKAVWHDDAKARLVNYLDGYQLDFPADAQFDFSLSPLFTRASGDGWDAVVSRETAKYESLKEVISFELSTFFPFLHDEGVGNYVNHYEWRFLTDAGWQQANRVSVTEQSEYWQGGRLAAQVFSATLQDPGDAAYDTYLYATVYTKSREYLRVVVRCDSADTATTEHFRGAIEHVRTFAPTGVGHFETDYYPGCDEAALSDEARALYDSLRDFSAPLRWGVFTRDVFTTGIDETIPALETALDHRFDVVLGYIHFNMPFPSEFMEKNYAQGRLVELTWQLTENNNEDMFAHTPFLDIYRGERDDEIRAVARDMKAFGHPFLLRLNNEMNSDWTSYSGVVNLADPQMFAAVWQRIYRIFAEEGVDNCLWIYNPNDRNAPPTKWNDSLAYYPGNEYVHLLGVTGYNNGTYYTQWNEQWRDFTTIYDEIEALYQPHFARFPWIITEFASSSYGGDKAKWIDEMFAHIGDYPNLRIAVWFSYADFDGETPARPYWLDETPETLAAFRRGLNAEN